MSFSSVLITANEDSAAPLFEAKKNSNIPFIHLPLEHFSYKVDPEESRLVEQSLSNYAFIIHGNLRNSRYFLQWVIEAGLLDEIRESVHLAIDKPTSEILEEYGIPAIMPRVNAKPIDVLEFMLRISREGASLYPTTSQKTEEIPGLIKELEMPVDEFSVCQEVTIDPEKLNQYRKKIEKEKPEAILFHNRSSVVRIKNAFPDLNLSNVTCIAGSAGVTQKMKEEEINVDVQAHGSWESVLKILGVQTEV